MEQFFDISPALWALGEETERDCAEAFARIEAIAAHNTR